MPEDKTIIYRFKDGDAAAFDTIYHQYSKRIYNFAYGLIKDQDTAAEIVQEIFVNLWEKHEQVNIELNFKNYIFTITYNSIRKYYRNKSIETRVKDYLLNNTPEIIENTDGGIIFNELLDLANKTIEKLPPKRKMVYKLSRQEGIKIKEIARRLDISTRTAENHLAKALKYLEEELAGSTMISLLFYHLFIN
ncbi:MAG: RNA polymerase sigma-70 factor [Bacteroidales bacterium]|nr:RNA polymerase sigma-70 factor [Bacteroidales bacterium]